MRMAGHEDSNAKADAVLALVQEHWMSVTDGSLAIPLGLQAEQRRGGSGLLKGALIERLLSLNAVVAVCVLAMIAMFIPHSMADPDIWWHLRNAHTMLLQHVFVRHDTMSFTATGAPWIDHEWLAELPFYLGWKIGGATGVYVVTVSIIEAIFGGVLFLSWRRSHSLSVASAATLIAALLSAISFGPRTFLFGWLCLVVELTLLELVERYPRVLLGLPVLFATWINLHGSWVIGLTVLAVYTFSGSVRAHGAWLEATVFHKRQKRRLVFTWLGTIPALLCNPWGWRLVAYPFNLAFHQTLNIANVEEWHSLDLHSMQGRVVAAVLALLVGKQVLQPRRWYLADLLLLALGLWSAFNYSRFLFLLALLAAPIAAQSFSTKEVPPRVPSRPVLNGALLVLVLSITAFALLKNSRAGNVRMEQFPKEAMPALEKLDPHLRVFNEYLWGGYLEWYFPERKVFIDSRVDIFEYNGTFRDYLSIVRVDDTLALLDKYSIDAVFFEKDTPLIYLLTHTGGWKTTYDDGKNILLERSSPIMTIAR